MNKYFDENRCCKFDNGELMQLIGFGAATVSSNLFFHEVYADEVKDDSVFDEKLADSALSVIAYCEAILSRYDDEFVEERIEEVASNVKPIDTGIELLDALMKVFKAKED